MQIFRVAHFKLRLAFKFSGCLMKFCYQLLVCEFRHPYCSKNMFPNFGYARCATGFEPLSRKEIFSSPYLSRPALGLFSCDLTHWHSKRKIQTWLSEIDDY